VYTSLRYLDAAVPAAVPATRQIYEQSRLPLYMITAIRRQFTDEDSPEIDATKKSTAAGTTGGDGSNPSDNENFDWQDDPDD
jgi:hypothetical protein